MPRYLDLEVQIEETKPRVWRRFLLKEDATFQELHDAIQDAFGWTRTKAWEFFEKVEPDSKKITDSDEDAENSASIALSEHFAWKGGSRICGYLYDTDDRWWHRVRLRGYHNTDKRFKRRLKGGKRACPVEGTGGPGNYVRSIRVIGGRLDDPELKAKLGDWDPKAFALREHARTFFIPAAPTSNKTARTKTRREADSIIQSLLTTSDISDSAITEALEDIHNGALQRALVNQLFADDIDESSAPVALRIIEMIGLGRQAGKLAAAVDDEALSEGVRALSQKFLDTQRTTAAVAVDAPEPVTPLDLLRSVHEDDLLGALERSLSEVSFADFEKVRKQQRISALGLYRSAFDERAFHKDRSAMREAISAERSPLRFTAMPGSRLPRVSAEERLEPDGLMTWISDCDDQGQYTILIRYDDDTPDTMPVFLELQADITGGVVRGEAHTTLTDDEILDRIITAGEHYGADLIAAPSGGPATLLLEALERSLDGSQQSFAVAATMAHLTEPVAMPVPDAGSDEFLPLDSLHLMLNSAPQWLIQFDRIETLDVDLPQPKDVDVWRSRLAEAMNTAEMRSLYQAMLRHTARLRLARGETLLAQRYARLANDCATEDGAEPLFMGIAYMFFAD
ncbi:MAG: plasmid pRiA4b ORF-3 family protein [Myxococcota bacterium]